MCVCVCVHGQGNNVFSFDPAAERAEKCSILQKNRARLPRYLYFSVNLLAPFTGSSLLRRKYVCAHLSRVLVYLCLVTLPVHVSKIGFCSVNDTRRKERQETQKRKISTARESLGFVAVAFVRDIQQARYLTPPERRNCEKALSKSGTRGRGAQAVFEGTPALSHSSAC